MIRGVLNDDLEALVPLQLRNSAGFERQIDAVVDTGFNGYLSLSPVTIDELHLVPVGTETVQLADGTVVDTLIHMGFVRLGDWESLVPIQRSDGAALIGTRLLYDHRLTMDLRFGGPFTIESLP